MATKADVFACLTDTRDLVTSIVEAMPEASWTNTAHNDGWNARQLLYHIASTSGVASFVLAMSRVAAPSGAGASEPFDNDAFNRDQVTMREGRSVNEALDEVRARIQRSIQDIEAASDADIQRTWTAPWGNTDTVAVIIIDSLRGHLGTHVAELRAAVA